MTKSHDTIATRLVLILTKFNSGERFTVEELSLEFNVDKRTIQRDLNERLFSLPIKKENDYYSLETYALGKLNFEDIKNFATIGGIKGLYPKLTNSFISDILNSKINSMYLVKNHGFEDLAHKTEEFELISVAILHHQPIQFSYNDKDREVNPYKLVNNQGIWYLVGDENGILKNYSFNKIVTLEVLETKFAVNNKFATTIQKNETNWFSQTVIDVTLEIDNKVAEYFLRRKILPNQIILRQTDEKLLISTKISYDEEILKVAQYWLPHIKIISPIYLHEKLHDLLKRYLEI